MKLKAHLFICTNSRENSRENRTEDKGPPPRPSCGPAGGVAIKDYMKQISQEPGRRWMGKVRINASGCLGRCEEGCAAVLYPQGKWWTRLDGSNPKKAAEGFISEIEKILKEDRSVD